MPKSYRDEPTTEEMIADTIRLSLGTNEQLGRTKQSLDARIRALEGNRNTEHGGTWDSFGEFLLAVQRAASGDVEKRLEQRAAGLTGNGVPSDGGFILPVDFSAVLASLVNYSAPLASRCLNLPARKRSVSLPAIDETSRAEGSRWGGVQSYWINEGDTVAAKKPKFRSLQLNLKKLMAHLSVTEELNEDSGALGTFVAKAFTAEAAYVLDSMVSGGTGAGQPLGFLNSPALITVSKETGQAAATILPINVTNMVARLLPECFDSAVWVMGPEVFGTLYTAPLTNGTSNLLTPPDASAPRGRLASFPIVVSETASALGSVGDIALVSLPYYAVYGKPIDIGLSMEVRFLNGEGVYRFSYRVDGAPILKSAITPKNGTVTKSAFVTLAARA